MLWSPGKTNAQCDRRQRSNLQTDEMAVKENYMDGKTFIVIAYDISNDKRRTKLHKTLKNYGSPVQYSVFECLLEKDELKKMKKDVNKVLRPKSDHLRYYIICDACKKKIEIIGRSEVLDEKALIVV